MAVKDFQRHPDAIDQAQQINEMHLDNSLAQFRAKNKPEQVQNEDGSWPVTECILCEIDLPEVRLKLGRVRCRDCQERVELAQKRGGR